MRNRLLNTSLCVLALAFTAVTTQAGTNLVTTTIQAAGANWTAAIWKTNVGGVGTGTAVAPVAGNTYTEIQNGTNTIGNGLNDTRVRNPAVAGLTTFPGDSLTLNVNTELRCKTGTAGTTTTQISFPGTNGNAGLVLNGGLIDAGDDTSSPFTFLGSFQVARQSYISHGANGGGGGISANRAISWLGVLSGTGNMVILNTGLVNPQLISNTSNTFSGQWILECGWLLGGVSNSLGTNSITVDPFYTGYTNDMPNAQSPNGPTQFEVNYDLNSAGVLILTNGGLMKLHQHCAFTSVIIEGNVLAQGNHFYNELSANFPANFAPGGSGSLTVQPFGILPQFAPTVNTQPIPQPLYAGKTAHFSITAGGAAPLIYQWRRGGTNLTDGGNVLGSLTNALTITGVSAADAFNYDCVVTNQGGSITSSVAALTIVAPSGEPYEAAVIAANPVNFYQLNDLGDPSTNAFAFDFESGTEGVYGAVSLNGFDGIVGPTSATGYPGFSAGNFAAQFAAFNANSHVTIANGWNLNTNTVTLTAWINPSGPQDLATGIVFCRGGDTVAGLDFTGTADINGQATLGYTWNNEFETYSFNSGIEVPSGIWSLAAVVVTPTDATIYLMNANGIVSSTHTYPHVVQSFNGLTEIGDDSFSATGARAFQGQIDDVAVFNRSLGKSELVGLFTAASGVSSFTPTIVAQPTNLVVFAGQTAQFSVTAGGSDPLTFQWKHDTSGNNIFVPLSNGGRISGADTATLTIQNAGPSDANNYMVQVSNPVNSVNSSPASLTVNPTIAPTDITMTTQEAAGSDWDTTGVWSDGNSATLSAAMAPGNTYDVLAGARLRSPANPRNAAFPGAVLSLDGNGVFVNNPGVGTLVSELRFKQPNPGLVFFPKLVLNGGQLDTGNDGIVEITGEIDIETNAPFYNDGTTDRGYMVDAVLKGGSGASIEYHGYSLATFQSNYVNGLLLTCNSNAYSGKWNVVIGAVIGAGTNSLGTNDISVGTQGVLESLYDLTNNTGNLFLSGQMYLHQNDTFRSLFVNGTPLAVGTYTFAQLNTAFPANFPATWGRLNGTTVSNGSGSITVLVQPAPTIVLQPTPTTVSIFPTQSASFTVQAAGTAPLAYHWRYNSNFLSDVAGNIIGSLTTNLIITNAVATNAGFYDVVVTNSIGSVTSVVAQLIILPTGPPEVLTLDFGGNGPILQAAGFDWNTPTNWSDGNPASTSALSNPGSTYEVAAGGRLRSPVGLINTSFPGAILQLDGSGVLNNVGNDNTLSELRFKHSDPGTVFFPKLVMNGGQIDNGDNGLIIIQGEMDILTNAPIYVDTAAGQDRYYQIDALLTGTGTITYQAFDATFTGNINITGTHNTFSGQWNVIQGVLLGTGNGSLGTNSITINNTAALETLYDINSPGATLTVNGQVFLHQHDTFGALVVNGTPVTPGLYSFSQLNTQFPTNFPATWLQQSASGIAAGSGSIQVGPSSGPPPPVTIQFQLSGSNLQLTWSQGVLLETTNLVDGPWVTNNATSPFTVVPTGPGKYYKIKVQ